MDMQVYDTPITKIKPYENNPRKNDGAVDAVAASIKEFGWQQPIVIDKQGVIVAGHTRYKSAKKLGLQTVPCVIADDLTDEQIKAFRIADNSSGAISEWDIGLLDFELADIDMDMGQFGLEDVHAGDYGTEFTLPEDNAPKSNQITFIFSKEQKIIIENAMQSVADDVKETYGNTNKAGNELFEVVRQWAELKKSN